MRIIVEFLGFPIVTDVIGKKKLELVAPGETLKDVINELITRYGEKVRDAFYNARGNFDPMIQIALNGKSFIPVDKHDTLLEDGDSIVFMILLAGG
jgi:molybdopterin converting factor small subunit